jgi:hypothetical protein
MLRIACRASLSTLFMFALGSLVAAAAALAAPEPATAAQPAVEQPSTVKQQEPDNPGKQPRRAAVLDHFLCYRTMNLDNPAPSTVQLKDQFDQEYKTWRTLGPHRFCNPARKVFEGEVTEIGHRDHHLTYYRGEAVATPPAVLATNQLAPAAQRLDLGRVDGLFVPTEKNSPRDHPAPTGLDHFKCYVVKAGAAIGKPVDLFDELEVPFAAVMVGRPVLFCNPTAKIHDGVQTPILNPRDHLTCYEISKTVESPFGGVTQLGDVRLAASGLEWLCVPSEKALVKD